MRSNLPFALTSLALLLAACGEPPPTRLDFATSPAIFRGTYSTEVDFRVSSPEVAFIPESSRLVMANGDHFHALQFWDVDTATPTGTTAEQFWTDTVSVSPDGSRVAAVLPGEAGNLPGSARVWDTESLEVLLEFPASSPGCLKCLARALTISPDAQVLALLSVREFAEEAPTSEVSLYDLKTGKPLAVLSGPPPSPYASYSELSFSPDGSRLAAIGIGSYEAAEVAVWDVASGQLLGTYTEPTPDIMQTNAHLWQGNAPVIAFAGGGQLELRDVISGQVLTTLPLPAGDVLLYNLYASADGTRLIGGTQGNVVLWDVAERRVLKVLSDSRYSAAGFSPDGRYALVWDDATRALTLRDPDTLGVEKTLVNGAVVPLTLTSEATYVNGRSYRIEGSAKFGEEAPVPFSGEVLGNETQVYLSPRFGCICPDPASLQLSFTRAERTWTMSASANGSGPEAWDLAALSEKGAPAAPARHFDVPLRKLP